MPALEADHRGVVPLHVVLRCARALLPKVRYVLDTMLMAKGVPVVYVAEPPPAGVWLLYASAPDCCIANARCLWLAHCPDSWRYVGEPVATDIACEVDGLPVLFPAAVDPFDRGSQVTVDVVANAFYFLSSWWERRGRESIEPRRMYSTSIFARTGTPQDVVDRYLERLIEQLNALCRRCGQAEWRSPGWPEGASYAVVLSHDVDFLPGGLRDTLVQGGKTLLRHLIRHRDLSDAGLAALGLARALFRGVDAYGCVPEIIEQEKTLGLRASFQVAVVNAHPLDVNYRIEDKRVRDYLSVIPESGFDLCLHGSYRSTESTERYVREVELLTATLGRPLGSRQHFLAFDYDTLFSAQERAGIQYDMSIGFPDRVGPRAGFSYPFFPYCLRDDRPYDVVEFSLMLMDVTLRSYMGLKAGDASRATETAIDDVRRKGGSMSVVWHPIVFGGARDPGYDKVFWDLTSRVRATGGLPTDGRTLNAYWRRRARHYVSFASHMRGRADGNDPDGSIHKLPPRPEGEAAGRGAGAVRAPGGVPRSAATG
jgi:hypothetical protein